MPSWLAECSNLSRTGLVMFVNHLRDPSHSLRQTVPVELHVENLFRAAVIAGTSGKSVNEVLSEVLAGGLIEAVQA